MVKEWSYELLIYNILSKNKDNELILVEDFNAHSNKKIRIVERRRPH